MRNSLTPYNIYLYLQIVKLYFPTVVVCTICKQQSGRLYFLSFQAVGKNQIVFRRCPPLPHPVPSPSQSPLTPSGPLCTISPLSPTCQMSNNHFTWFQLQTKCQAFPVLNNQGGSIIRSSSASWRDSSSRFHILMTTFTMMSNNAKLKFHKS